MTTSVTNFFAPSFFKKLILSIDALKYPKPATTEALGHGAFLSSIAHADQNKTTKIVFGI